MTPAPKRLTWLGHNCFLLEYGKVKFIVDPYLVDGIAPASSNELKADYLLVSHGHGDHCGSVVEIAKRTNAVVIAVAEVAGYFSHKNLKTEPVNIGGAIYVPISENPTEPQAQILAVQAPHSSTTPDGASGGNSLGFILSFSQNGTSLSPKDGSLKPMSKKLADASAFSVYFACDTGYFSEMKWIGELGIDIAVLPIGDRYTMGPSLSLDATSLINPRYVVPAHYNTWPPISQDADAWEDAIRQYTKATPLVLSPGKSISEHDDGAWE